MKKVIICGCSYMFPDRHQSEFIGTHFSELLSKQLDCEVVYFSKPGSSNGGICVQIQEAILEKPDLILFGQTLSDRVEIRITDDVFENIENTYLFECQNVRLSEIEGPYENDPVIKSDNLIGLLHNVNIKNKSKEFNSVRTQALRDWFTYIYSPKMKQQTDMWCLYAVQHQLYESKIPALKIIDILGYDTPWYKCLTGKKFHPNIGDGPSGRYHTTKQSQVWILNQILDALPAIM